MFFFFSNHSLFLRKNAMTDQVFFDVPLSAQFADGAVRIELGIYKGEMKDKKRNVTPGATLVTTLPGILQLQGQINQLVEGLVEKKILTKKDSAK
jgi:hypothetical protein